MCLNRKARGFIIKTILGLQARDTNPAQDVVCTQTRTAGDVPRPYVRLQSLLCGQYTPVR